jgi:hypothetical protein
LYMYMYKIENRKSTFEYHVRLSYSAERRDSITSLNDS